jgi:N-sulfoglucosamine sulfohydrolase
MIRAFLLALLVCLPAQEAKKRLNVVLFVADDLGQDAGCYGNPVLRTPNLDRLAAEGTRFPFAFATTASCSASRSVILTGLYNHANAQFGHEHSYHHFRTYENLKSLPVMLSEAGYRTARIGKLHVGPEAVYRFDAALPGNARSPAQMAENSRAFIAAKDDRPFFLYFCTADPHRSGKSGAGPHKPDLFGNEGKYPGIDEATYDPKDVVVPPFLPDTPTCRAELAEYYRSVSRVDQGLGRLVQTLKDAGKWEDTLLIFMSDHGIAFPGGKTTVYEPGLRSPLVVRHPRAAKRGVVSNALLNWPSLTPTILDVAGALPKDAPFHGRSFLPILEEEDPAGWDEVYASHTFHEITMYYPMRVVRTRRHKLIWNLAHGLPYPFASDLWEAPTWQDVYAKGPDALYGKRTVKAYLHRPRFELYDLESDPHEVKNLADDPAHAALLKELQEKLKAFQKRTKDPWILKWDYE